MAGNGMHGVREGAAMELRHLDTLLAIAEEGSFTAAADALATVQSNVSDQVRQLEAELGVPAARAQPQGRRAHRVRHARARARPTGAPRARGDARRPRVAAGARGGLRPPRRGRDREPVARAGAGRRPARARARGAPAGERGCVGTALHRAGRRRARAGRRHRTGERPSARRRAPPRGGARRAGRAATSSSRPSRCRSRRSPSCRWCCRRSRTRCASRSSAPPKPTGLTLTVPVEVEGIRLIADLVVAGDYASILPETAIPPELRARAHRSPSPGSRRAGSPWSPRATRSCRSPTRPCATACAAWSRST